MTKQRHVRPAANHRAGKDGYSSSTTAAPTTSSSPLLPPSFSPSLPVAIGSSITMISRVAAHSTPTLSNLSSRSLRAPGAAARSFATAQESSPTRQHGGLKDQDRIFTNLYGHHGADIKSAMKYGDWYRTKDIVLKGHEWVCS